MDGKLLARQIFLRTLEALDVPASIANCVSCTDGLFRCGARSYDLRELPDLRIVAVGKAAHAMLDGLIALLPRESISLELLPLLHRRKKLTWAFAIL